MKTVAAGEGVGYGAAFVCPETMPIGVVAYGYGDGYPRHARTGTPVLVNGVRTQVIGECSMDMMTVDLRPVPGAGFSRPLRPPWSTAWKMHGGSREVRRSRARDRSPSRHDFRIGKIESLAGTGKLGRGAPAVSGAAGLGQDL